MQTKLDEFNSWLSKPEGLHLEFKAARSSFSQNRDLPDYCAALANEGGGKLVLGVEDQTRIVVGTNAFKGTHQRLSNDLLNSLHIRVDIEELAHPDGRVLIFHVPGRPAGQLIKSSGNYRYPMRAGESLVEMDQETMRRILLEREPDFSSKIAPGVMISDLDPVALDNFKKKWVQKSGRPEFLDYSAEKTLAALGAFCDEGVSYAGLILFGKKEKIDRVLPCSEIVFEWRNDSRKVPHDFRISWREPFFRIYDVIWETINARNIRFPFQDGFIQREILAFNEKCVREALLNAVAHRDYTINSESIFISANPEACVVESPGGLPAGITLENILVRRQWRNRAIVEILEKAGLVERSGQGMDDIFGYTIREGKGVPDLSSTTAQSVVLSIPAAVKDKTFILFLEKIMEEKQTSFSFEEIYDLEQVREQKYKELLRKDRLLSLGVIEKVGRGRGTKYILAHGYYKNIGKAGVHTKLKGLTREQKKQLIVNHLEHNKRGYSHEFVDALGLKRSDVSNLLTELRRIKVIRFVGHKKNGYWELVGVDQDGTKQN